MDESSSFVSGNCTFEQNVDYFVYGQSLDATVDSPQACCDACSKQVGCSFFTYYQGTVITRYRSPTSYPSICSLSILGFVCWNEMLIFILPHIPFTLGGCYFKYSESGKTTSAGRISGKCNNTPSLGMVNYALGCATGKRIYPPL